jgi:hypothetical protein
MVPYELFFACIVPFIVLISIFISLAIVQHKRIKTYTNE